MNRFTRDLLQDKKEAAAVAKSERRRARLQKDAWPDVPDAVRRTMKGNKSRDTVPEMSLRSLVHSMGYRFRTHRCGLPGKPDLAFSARRKAVWMHGCFWHSHPGCRFAITPRTRVEYWSAKLARNRQRDIRNAERLREIGWETMVVWECELRDADAVKAHLRAFLGPRRVRTVATQARTGGIAAAVRG